MESLRIILVSDWYLPRKGGVETAMYNLARILLARGHDPVVLTHQTKSNPNPPPLDSGDGFPVVRLKVPLKGDDYTTSYKAALQLFDFIKHNAPDVIHGHSLVSPFAVTAIHGAKGILGVPTVLTHHSLIYEELNPWRKILARYALRRVDIPTAVSTVVKNDLEKIYGRNRPPILLTPNCIDLDNWRKTSPTYEGDPVVSFIARLTKRKNPILAIKAFKAILEEKRKAHLYIAGEGPLEREVREYINASGVKENATLLGPLDREGVRKLLSSSHLFLMPGRKEAFSIASLEALSLGVPVIGFHGTGLEDMVVDGLNGFLAVDEGDFIYKTRLLATNERMRVAMSANAFNSARTFDCKAIVYRYLDAYRKAVSMCTSEKRVLLYSIYRILRGDPVKPGEWCVDRKCRYHRRRPRKNSIPYIRRGTGCTTLPG